MNKLLLFLIGIYGFIILGCNNQLAGKEQDKQVSNWVDREANYERLSIPDSIT
ncbi:MAG TPA: hypothetical protein VFD91_10135 [Mariniphaga sp.]|nr:hypothetical protein [Mariniphaga sp.]